MEGFGAPFFWWSLKIKLWGWGWGFGVADHSHQNFGHNHHPCHRHKLGAKDGPNSETRREGTPNCLVRWGQKQARAGNGQKKAAGCAPGALTLPLSAMQEPLVLVLGSVACSLYGTRDNFLGSRPRAVHFYGDPVIQHMTVVANLTGVPCKDESLVAGLGSRFEC